MSADNWTVCPRCAKLDPFMGDNETLREDYEFHMGRDGGFLAAYYAHCTDCGFSFEFRHAEQAEPEPAAQREGAAQDD